MYMTTFKLKKRWKIRIEMGKYAGQNLILSSAKGFNFGGGLKPLASPQDPPQPPAHIHGSSALKIVRRVHTSRQTPAETVPAVITNLGKKYVEIRCTPFAGTRSADIVFI